MRVRNHARVLFLSFIISDNADAGASTQCPVFNGRESVNKGSRSATENSFALAKRGSDVPHKGLREFSSHIDICGSVRKAGFTLALVYAF